eukprot:Gregarina_sp_Poly_1__5981@NODE_314_length_9596_cov_167_192570_g269_i0_p3_GENE_NODE_314_length_9596_cov_167_192570_g269_i0NODE_314_length_9596_cov_167_192570_g269_i0_p3_ORF_typecomplete_len380_score64_26AP2/PF00847_20/0_00056AP2/PF00847_20/2_8e03_NODE_314_length_9596_cov_167_192570_g269_i056446783
MKDSSSYVFPRQLPNSFPQQNSLSSSSPRQEIWNSPEDTAANTQPSSLVPTTYLNTIINVVGNVVPDQERYAFYACPGDVYFTVGFNSEDMARFWEEVAIRHQFDMALAAEEVCMEDLLTTPIVMHNLLVEVLCQHQAFGSLELTTLVPSQVFWEAAVANLARRLFHYTISAMNHTVEGRPKFEGAGRVDTQIGQHETIALDYFRLAHLVYNPLVSELKESLAEPVAQLSAQQKDRDEFAVDYEPTKQEIESLQRVPHCDVRGVGWNGSTKAWVASWLPLQSHKRICATFSTRKFGYHQAMKLAICQRVRSELLIYGRRRYPSNLVGPFVAEFSRAPEFQRDGGTKKAQKQRQKRFSSSSASSGEALDNEKSQIEQNQE